MDSWENIFEFECWIRVFRIDNDKKIIKVLCILRWMRIRLFEVFVVGICEGYFMFGVVFNILWDGRFIVC